MPKRAPGLYEVLVTESLAADLAEIAGDLIDRRRLDPADAADRLALHVARVIERALSTLPDEERAHLGVVIARELLTQTQKAIQAALDLEETFDIDLPVEPGQLLRAIRHRRPDGKPAEIEQPLTPLLDTTVLTNAPGEPRVGRQILAEIASADRIDLVMAFIRRSGLRPLEAALLRHCKSGRELRVLTTTYTLSTELAALELLVELGAQVRVSYDTSSTRLHAKAWLFHRESGFSTAFIGSSNLTHSAQVTGLEWNVRASSARNPDLLQKVSAVFESYWEGGDFRAFDRDEYTEQTKHDGARGPILLLSPIELRPEPFQERLLEQIALARERGHHRNLLVAATGTGKTVMAAVDYARLRQRLRRSRLLFVAHRKEILEQSLLTFRHALRDPSFGELWVGSHRPEEFEHVFASIQSLHAASTEYLPPDHFDVVIVDEFHHAAAESYARLLGHIRPQELLGLTATPERSDGLDILGHFDGRIAAELRLWDAIDQHRLAPFVYYGIHDGLDLRQVPWRRGIGYDVEGLSNVMTGNDVWARQVIQSLSEHVDDVGRIRALGFCVSVDHARFMARAFREAGIPSTAVWGDSPADERRDALAALRSRAIRVLFSVDLFNEGVDLPNVDTLLLLRPTESPLLFLQQLGRGLRCAAGKPFCTVLDFVGLHRQEFRFDRRLRALLGGTRREVERWVEQGFPLLPAGCHMQLDSVSQRVVLESLRRAIPSQWPAKVEELRQLAAGGANPTLAQYLLESGLELEDIYAGNRSWSDLRQSAALEVLQPGPREAELRRAVGRLLHVDDEERIATYCSLLLGDQPPRIAELPERQRRLARMLAAQIGDQVFTKHTSEEEGWDLLWRHQQVRAETAELLGLLSHRVDHLHHRLASHPDVPLQVHARYTRLEILGAFGVGQGAKIPSWQTGVRWLPDQRTDVFAFTLDKSSGSFSPTTRYRDYAISRELIHWESQGVTRAESETGLRYQNHKAQGSSVLLFARLRVDDRAFWFLGPANYVEHRGEKPMAITWRLVHALPGDLFAQFAAAVA
ncbi:MAG TPA: DUF3427 domain-containing protein [Thermoanaerobaculia bacterium]|nr:DUF3427 domain-containing protein [Thermoanaerobaculia bacterium]